MAINAKVVFFFNLARWGWTETYYWTSNVGDLRDALKAAEALATVRIPLNGNFVSLEAIRVSDLASKGSAYLEGKAAYNVSNSGLTIQEPWEALLLNLAGAGPASGIIYKRSLLLRGLPATWNGWSISNATSAVLPPAAIAPMNRFTEVLRLGSPLIAGNWALRANNKNLVTNPIFPITAVTLLQPGSFFGIEGGLPGGYNPGDRIHIGKAKGFGIKGLVGDAVITGPAVGGVFPTNRRQCGPASPLFFTTPAVVQAKVLEIVPINATNVVRFVKRDTGRAFFVTRGRQTRRSC